MPITFPPIALARIAYAAHEAVYNRRAPLKVDRKMMPFYSMLTKREEDVPVIGQNGPIIKYKTQSNLSLQGWERKDPLQFAEQVFELETQFPWSNIHQGTELVHDDVEAAVGGTIIPNQPRGKNIIRADSKSEAYRLVSYMEETIESMFDIYDVNADQLFLRNNSANPLMPQGFDAYWPVATTAGMVTDADGTRGYYNLGSVGNHLRSSYPDVLQHYLWINATYGIGGSLRRALTTAKREAQLRSRGRTKGGIKAILAGSRALDKYVSFATKNDTNYSQSITVLNNGGANRLDIGIPDSGLHFEGIPIVHCPTFEILDALDAPAIPWTDRLVLVDPESFCLAYAPGKKKLFSAPPDEGSVRVSRLSLDSKAVFLPKVLNANAIVSLAA